MPDLTPFHQVVLQIGMMGSTGGLALELPMICGKRRKISFSIQVPQRQGLVRNLVKTSPRNP